MEPGNTLKKGERRGKSVIESKNKENKVEDSWTQAEKLKCRNKADNNTRIHLVDSLRGLKQIEDES